MRRIKRKDGPFDKTDRMFADVPDELEDDEVRPIEYASEEEHSQELAELRKRRQDVKTGKGEMSEAVVDDETTEDVPDDEAIEMDPAMNTDEIEQAGLLVDVPYEAPPPGPGLRYQDGQSLESELRKIDPAHGDGGTTE